METTTLTPLRLLELAVYQCLRSKLPGKTEITVKFSAGCMKVICSEDDGIVVWRAMNKCFILNQLKSCRMICKKK